MNQMMAEANSSCYFKHRHISIYNNNVLNLYKKWPSPTVIISDGPYGLNSYDGDLRSATGLESFYKPHIKEWSAAAKPNTTLWFWNSELGWASVHKLLVDFGWKFVNCHVWNKGISHIAGNANTKTLRKFPVVTEVCVQYVQEPKINGQPMCDWLRSEWLRAGIPLSHSNKACGIKNAATRKYLTKDHLWYFPPPAMFEKLVDYANMHGDKNGMPYFSRNGKSKPFTKDEWDVMRAKFHCNIGITNVWNEPAVHGTERIRNSVDNSCVHPNQKPLKIMQRIIEASSDMGDMVWEPFGGMCTGAVAALTLNRRCKSAEINSSFYQMSVKRISESSKAHNSRLELGSV